MNKRLSSTIYLKSHLFNFSLTEFRSTFACMEDVKINVCLHRAPTSIQSLALGPTLRKVVPKPFKKSVRHNRSQSTRHRHPYNSANMSSIDAIVNAGPSAQQIDDEPVEKFDALNIREDSEGWNDVEEDNEEFNVQCLFCSELSTSLSQSLEHMKAQHEFDLVAFRTRHGG